MGFVLGLLIISVISAVIGYLLTWAAGVYLDWKNTKTWETLTRMDRERFGRKNDD